MSASADPAQAATPSQTSEEEAFVAAANLCCSPPRAVSSWSGVSMPAQLPADVCTAVILEKEGAVCCTCVEGTILAFHVDTGELLAQRTKDDAVCLTAILSSRGTKSSLWVGMRQKKGIHCYALFPVKPDPDPVAASPAPNEKGNPEDALCDAAPRVELLLQHRLYLQDDIVTLIARCGGTASARRVASCGTSGQLVVWDVDSYTQVYSLGLQSVSQASQIFSLVYSGQHVWCGGDDGSLTVVRFAADAGAPSPTQIPTVDGNVVVAPVEVRVVPAHSSLVTTMVVDPINGTVWTGGEDGTVIMWDAWTLDLIAVHDEQKGSPISVISIVEVVVDNASASLVELQSTSQMLREVWACAANGKTCRWDARSWATLSVGPDFSPPISPSPPCAQEDGAASVALPPRQYYATCLVSRALSGCVFMMGTDGCFLRYTMNNNTKEEKWEAIGQPTTDAASVKQAARPQPSSDGKEEWRECLESDLAAARELIAMQQQQLEEKEQQERSKALPPSVAPPPSPPLVTSNETQTEIDPTCTLTPPSPSPVVELSASRERVSLVATPQVVVEKADSTEQAEMVPVIPTQLLKELEDGLHDAQTRQAEWEAESAELHKEIDRLQSQCDALVHERDAAHADALQQRKLTAESCSQSASAITRLMEGCDQRDTELLALQEKAAQTLAELAATVETLKNTREVAAVAEDLKVQEYDALEAYCTALEEIIDCLYGDRLAASVRMHEKAMASPQSVALVGASATPALLGDATNVRIAAATPPATSGATAANNHSDPQWGLLCVENESLKVQLQMWESYARQTVGESQRIPVASPSGGAVDGSERADVLTVCYFALRSVMGESAIANRILLDAFGGQLESDVDAVERLVACLARELQAALDRPSSSITSITNTKPSSDIALLSRTPYSTESVSRIEETK